MAPELNPTTAADHATEFANSPEKQDELFSSMQENLGDALAGLYSLSDAEVKTLNGIPEHVVSDMIHSIKRAHACDNGTIDFVRPEGNDGPKWELIHHVTVTPDPNGGPHKIETKHQTRCMK